MQTSASSLTKLAATVIVAALPWPAIAANTMGSNAALAGADISTVRAILPSQPDGQSGPNWKSLPGVVKGIMKQGLRPGYFNPPSRPAPGQLPIGGGGGSSGIANRAIEAGRGGGGAGRLSANPESRLP
jgi:hypothetical protein